MITSKKELRFYLMADRIMSGLTPKASVKEKLLMLFNMGGVTNCFLQSLRHVAYYQNTGNTRTLGYLFWYYKYRRLSMLLGFSIGPNSIGWATVIPHWGTIVVNPDCRIGNYAVLHTCTCVGGEGKTIGNGLYLSTGSQIMRPLTLGDNVMVASHSLVNSSFEGGILLAGCPAQIKKKGLKAWYDEQNGPYGERVKKIENLRKELF